jgi:predicted Holliday junction resolvase-like endonuclease
MIIAIIVLVLTSFFAVKDILKKRKKIKSLETRIELFSKEYKKQHDIEVNKTKIREDLNAKENNIDTGDSYILPNKTRHNHGFGKPCRKDCPRFNN